MADYEIGCRYTLWAWTSIGPIEVSGLFAGNTPSMGSGVFVVNGTPQILGMHIWDTREGAVASAIDRAEANAIASSIVASSLRDDPWGWTP